MQEKSKHIYSKLKISLFFRFAVCSQQNPSRMSYQKMDERVPSGGRIQLNNIPILRYGEEELENINITTIGRNVGIAQDSHKYKQVSTAWKLKKLLWAEKSLNTVILNEVIFISIESECQGRLDLHKMQPDDLLINTK